MADFSMWFQAPINSSVQVGDTIHYNAMPTYQNGGFSVLQGAPTQLVEIKSIIEHDTNSDGAIDTVEIVCDVPAWIGTPDVGDYIFFSKNREVNDASISGYYANFRFKNDSKAKAELFTAACEIVESSK
tara:strand:- start:466 stop:852 length:387 start_codon:yes stop_codon:yes gene_type:complete